MAGHLNIGMNNGLTQTEIAEAITHLAFYVGWPNVFSAMPVAKEVFEKRSLSPPRDQEGARTMPHVIVKLWPGKSEQQKKKLADEINEGGKLSTLNYGEEARCRSRFEEVRSMDWTEKVYKPDILAKRDTLLQDNRDTNPYWCYAYSIQGCRIAVAPSMDLRQVAPCLPARCRSASTTSAKAAEDWRRLG